MAFALRGIWLDAPRLGGVNAVCPYGVAVDEFKGWWLCRYIAASAGAFLRVWHDTQPTIDRLHLLGYLERVS